MKGNNSCKRNILAFVLAAVMIVSHVFAAGVDGISALAASAQANVISQTADSVTIGVDSLGTGGLFITSDMSKTTYANVGYAGDMPLVNGKAQYTITKVPVMDGAGFTNEPLSEGDQFKYWVRVTTSAGEVIQGPFEYTHDVAAEDTQETESSADSSGSGSTGNGEAPTVTMTYNKPEVDESLVGVAGSHMYFTISNNTSGKYADDKVFLTIIGREWNDNPEQAFSYLTADGKLPLLSTRSNDKSKTVYNPNSGLYDTVRSYTNLGFTIADLKALGQVDANGNAYVKLPPIRSGRMYISYGEDICISITADGFAGPDLNNPTDPNQTIVFDFVEFTYNDIGEFWGNTTRVDGYVFPISIRLTGTVDDLDANGNLQYDGNGNVLQKDQDIWAGDLGTLEEIVAMWEYQTRPGTLFEAFNHLLVKAGDGVSQRISAPGKGEFDSGIYSNYFDEYINYVWNMYATNYNSNNPMVFTTQAGRFVQTGTATGAAGCNGSYGLKDGSLLLEFKHEVWNQSTGGWFEPYEGRRYYIHKPTTAEVLEGKGAFDHHHEQGYGGDTSDLVIQSQLCAAFNRGVAHINEDINTIYSTNPNDPTGIYSNGNPIAPWGDVSSYYQVDDVNKGVFNFYAKFWHDYGVYGKAYGFCYDDVWEQSTLLYTRFSDVLSIDCYSYGRTFGDSDETQAPSTEAPSTEAPSTEAPSTEAPSTQAPSVSESSGDTVTPGSNGYVYDAASGTVTFTLNDSASRSIIYLATYSSESEARNAYDTAMSALPGIALPGHAGYYMSTSNGVHTYSTAMAPGTWFVYGFNALGTAGFETWQIGVAQAAAVEESTEAPTEAPTEPSTEPSEESSENSSEVLVKPSKVTGVKAVYENGKIKVTWNDNGAAQYRVMRFTSETGYKTMTYKATAAGYVDTDLIEAQLYYYRICGYFYDANGNLVQGSVSDSVAVVATDKDPAKVTNLSASVNNGTVTLTWDAADGVRYYKIARAYGWTTADGSYSCLKYNVSETTYTDTPSYKGKWRYKVVGYYKDTDGSWVYGDMSSTLFLTVE